MFSPRSRDVVPGPGAYNPFVPSTAKLATIRPLPPAPVQPDSQDKEAVVAYESKRKFMEDLEERKRRMPEPGSYTLKSVFGDGNVSPRGQSPRVKSDGMFGTPRSERTVFNVDLYDVSKRPGPGQYRLDRDGIGGRDRLYRKKLPIETINFMAPQLPPISPRR